MKKIFFLFFLFQNIVYGTITQPLAIHLGAGYREDHFSFKILTDTDDNVLLYREKYKHPRYLESLISLRAIERDLYFLINFGYGCLLTKSMNLKDRNDVLYDFDYRTKGYDLETMGEIGYAVNLIPERINKFIVIPIFGYSGFWKILRRKSPIFNPFVSIQNSEIENVYSSLNRRKLKQIWYGPYIGGRIEIIPNDKVIFDLGYHFNWLRMKLKFISSLEVINFDQNYTMISNKISFKDMDDTIKDCYSHFAMAKITYLLTKKIKTAFLIRCNYYNSDKEKASMNIKTDYLFPQGTLEEKNTNNKVFARWWNISGILEFIFEF